MFNGPKGWKGLSWGVKYNSQCRLSSNSGSLEVNRPPQWVKHVVSIHVKALSNETSLEKYGYFHLLCICLSQHVLCDVRVFRCIIERHSSVIKYLTVIPFHFLFSWTNHKNFPISLCFVFLHRISLFLWQQRLNRGKDQHLTFLWNLLMNPCGARSVLNWYFTRKLPKVAHFFFCAK